MLNNSHPQGHSDALDYDDYNAYFDANGEPIPFVHPPPGLRTLDPDTSTLETCNDEKLQRIRSGKVKVWNFGSEGEELGDVKHVQVRG